MMESKRASLRTENIKWNVKNQERKDNRIEIKEETLWEKRFIFLRPASLQISMP